MLNFKLYLENNENNNKIKNIFFDMDETLIHLDENSNFYLRPHVYEVLELLKNLNYKLYILTAAHVDHINNVFNNGFDFNYFDGIISTQHNNKININTNNSILIDNLDIDNKKTKKKLDLLVKENWNVISSNDEIKVISEKKMIYFMKCLEFRPTSYLDSESDKIFLLILDKILKFNQA